MANGIICPAGLYYAFLVQQYMIFFRPSRPETRFITIFIYAGHVFGSRCQFARSVGYCGDVLDETMEFSGHDLARVGKSV